ncbi:MAG: protein kinase [Verrucomicrobiales bacterium]|nr:protein kinase [Verrucomicrobiales bacterium]
MSQEFVNCSSCGLPESHWMDGLCPICLLDLGDASGDGLFQTDGAGVEALRRRLGDYEILELIARGGMGVVYRARQVSLNREVAVKVLLGGAFASEAFLRRFQREAEAAASLSHPNIVSIYEVGESEGQPFFSMELITGKSLADLSRDNSPSLGSSVGLVRTLAQAVQYAHERGVLHRDLKPSNILVDDDGQPHITDFGLAKRVAEDSELTLPGQVMGSPNYLAPEQANGGSGPSGPGCDIYSLGAILYHLLTGRPPHLAETVAQTLRLAVEADPVAPRLLNPSVSRDLETICLKCLEKAPERRYGSAQVLADELGRVLRKEPIQARPVSWFERAARWCRRKPALAASILAIILLLVAGGWGASLAVVRIQSERDAAESARWQETRLRARAEAAERTAQDQLYGALLGEARATVRSGSLGQRVQALQAVRSAAGISNSVELRREALAALALPDLRFDREIALSPSCTFAVLDPGFLRFAAGDGTNAIEIRSAADLHLTSAFPLRGGQTVLSARWSQDGRFLGVRLKPPGSSSSFRVQVWDVDAQRLLLELPQTQFGAFSFHPSLPQILADAGESQASLFDLERGKVMATFPILGSIHHLEFAPGGRSFVAQHRVHRPWFTTIFDLCSGEVVKSKLTAWVDSLAWHPSGLSLVAGARNGEVHVHDRISDDTRPIGRHKNSVRSAVFSPDGNFLFTGSDEREIVGWDYRTQRRALTVPLRGEQIQFRSDGRRWATWTRTGLRIYTPEFVTPQRELVGHLGNRLKHVSFSPDGRWLAAGGLSRVGLWSLDTDAPPIFPLEDEHSRPLFSPDSQELWCHSRRALARWRIQRSVGGGTAAPLLTPLRVPEVDRVYWAQFTSNRFVLSVESGFVSSSIGAAELDVWRSPYLGLMVGIVSPDGEWMAARRRTGVEIYRVAPWGESQWVDFRMNVIAHAFVPDGSELAVTSRSGVTFLDAREWRPVRSLSLPLEPSSELLFEPGGAGVWLTQDVLDSGLYGIRSLEPWLQLPAGYAPRAVSADGRFLAVTVDLERLQIWDWQLLRQQMVELGVDWPSR